MHAKRINTCVSSVGSGLKVKSNFNNTKTTNIQYQEVPIHNKAACLTQLSWNSKMVKTSVGNLTCS